MNTTSLDITPYVPITIKEAIKLYSSLSSVRWAWFCPELLKWQSFNLPISLNMVKSCRIEGSQIFIHKDDYERRILLPKPYKD